MNISIPQIQEPIFSGQVFCFVNNERMLFDGTWHGERMTFDVPDGITYTIKAQRKAREKKLLQNPEMPIKTKKGIAIETVQYCNMKCRHCSHYCNYNRKGCTPIDTIIYSLLTWSKRLLPASVCITGGECFLHPELGTIIEYARQFYPATQLRVFTNGILLEQKLPKLANILKSTNSTLVISAKNYKNVCKKDWTETIKRGIAVANAYEIPVELKNFNWLQIQNEPDKNGKPKAFHGDSEVGFKNCTTKNCSRFIYRDKIWKCPPAYIAHKMAENNEIDKSDWADMLSSEPATVEWSRDMLLQFFEQKPCICCKNCTQQKIIYSKFNPAFPDGTTKNYITETKYKIPTPKPSIASSPAGGCGGCGKKR